jgi:hypothetical protein
MSEAKFTPGPWEFDVEIHWVNQPGEQEVHGAWDVYPVDDCDHIIATVNHVYPDRNTCRYNARLIAAAPAMYEALHRAVTEMEFWSKGHSDAEIAIAHAALAQAEGAVVRMVPHSTSDVCWCQPFDGPKHPNCPMHGKPLEECLFRVLYFLESHLLVDWHYMEGEGFYRDKTALVEDIRKTLDIGNAGR